MDANLKTQTLDLAHDLAEQATSLNDVNNLLQLLMKSALEKMLNTELNVHLQQQKLATETATTTSPKKSNRKNGTSPKMLQSELGKLPLDIPRDRDATFEPKVLPKHQRRLPGFDEKILALYAKGMTTRDIQDVVFPKRSRRRIHKHVCSCVWCI
jgi:putative transposase